MELVRALSIFCEPPDPPVLKRVAATLELGDPPTASEFTELFVFQLPPYLSIYVGADGMIGGDARDRVAGFWRALGQTPPVEADHLAALLALYARLTELEIEAEEETQRGGWRRARKAFLWEHLLSWLTVYLDKLVTIAPSFYVAWGELLLNTLLREVELIGHQYALPLHLREAPALNDPRETSIDEFVGSVLTPVRSGMLLTRADLRRAASDLDVSLRAGERRFMLKGLLEQDAPVILGWLAEEATMWIRRHQSHRSTIVGIAEWWQQKAEKTLSVIVESGKTH